MSAFSPDSDVSRFNGHKGTDWFPVGRDTAGVVSLALDIGERSGGALDITVAPLVNLWSFGWKKQPDAAPSDEDIADALRHVGLEKLEARLDPPALRKLDPELTIDLAAVAKGYAVDVVSRTLEANGAVAYLVDIGGELRVAGRKPGGDPWLVGIEKPVSDKRAVQRTIGFTDNSMATSGSYRNYFEQNGERFSHLLDPRSGRPIRHRLVSASVVDPSCAFADAWATALMVLGPSEGLAVAEREGLAALLIVNTDGGFVESLSSSFSAVETPRGSKS